jgi:hypothetical protein
MQRLMEGESADEVTVGVVVDLQKTYASAGTFQIRGRYVVIAQMGLAEGVERVQQLQVVLIIHIADSLNK